MKKDKISTRQLKKKILQFFEMEDLTKGLGAIRRLPPRQAVNPLFSLLCSLDEQIRWKAITAIGTLVSDLATSDLESARVVMRRFIWNLNDESGGIGWGCPESMAEAMAQNEDLAEEFGCILISYIQPDGNYLEHEGLQRGVLWGIGRLAHARPRYARDAAAFLPAYMQSPDPILRGLAVWAVGPLFSREALPRLNQLASDHSQFKLFSGGQMVLCSVGRLAAEALAAFEQGSQAGSSLAANPKLKLSDSDTDYSG